MAVLVALWFGMTLAPCTHVTASRLWWLVGSGALVALYFLSTWLAFAGQSPRVFLQHIRAQFWELPSNSQLTCDRSMVLNYFSAEFLDDTGAL